MCASVKSTCEYACSRVNICMSLYLSAFVSISFYPCHCLSTPLYIFIRFKFVHHRCMSQRYHKKYIPSRINSFMRQITLHILPMSDATPPLYHMLLVCTKGYHAHRRSQIRHYEFACMMYTHVFHCASKTGFGREFYFHNF